jgi:hypothetical protein
MRMSAKIAAAATLLLIGAAGPTTAMPIAPPLSAVGSENANTSIVQEARLVCGPRGCVRVGPRRSFASFLDGTGICAGASVLTGGEELIARRAYIFT